MMDNPVIFTITQESDTIITIHTKDGRIKGEDREVQASPSKLINAMIMISEILNDEGFAVLFEVD